MAILRYQLLREFRHGLRQECVALSFRSVVATILWASRTSGPSGYQITGPARVLFPATQGPFVTFLLEQVSEYSAISVRTLECTPPGSPSGKIYATLCICLLRSRWGAKRCTLNLRT